ncbi:peptidoglycan-binding domain-containing protein [Actinokineospora sp.]|uniref:peptidoglycan-binding domain-containing protein n=1 Tax=Actinokineospora sp. TaxID=1872133 RepID=UPI003D6B1DA5
MDSGLTLGPAGTPKFGIHPGERDRAKVDHLGATLKRLYPGESGWAVRGGVYGPEMVGMVKRFQRAAGIKASGIVGPKTWSAMYDVISVSGGWGR